MERVLRVSGMNALITPQDHKDIIRKHDPGSTWDLTADVVIVGSGAGGAVAAAELAKSGWNVILLEEGGNFHPGKFNNDEFLSLQRLYRDAGSILTEDQTVTILQGRTLGGSTTVNWQTSLYPPEYVTDEWRDRFGLPGYGRGEMDVFVSEIHKRLNVHTVPPELRNENNNVLLKGGKKLGLDPEILMNNNVGCRGTGRCGLGCPVNAKQSMFLTYIPDALAAGARVFTNFRAVKIADGKTKTLTAEFTPDPFEETPGEIIETLRVKAPVVIVSAGAIEGPALLQRSSLGNDWVGRNLKLHPTSAILARFPHEIRAYSGPPQSAVIKAGHNQDGTGYGFWLEVAPSRPALTAAALPYYAKQNFDIMKDYPYMNAGIVLVRDGADGETAGSVEWSWGKRKVRFELTPGDGRNLLRGLKMLAEVQAAAGATEMVFPFGRLKAPMAVNAKTNFDWILSESFAPNTMSLFSAHPHGSIQAAADPARGAISPDFELYEHENIFVMDASWFPTGLSVNPQITTMSSVLRAARKLAGEKTRRIAG